jgi:hypothetical protein
MKKLFFSAAALFLFSFLALVKLEVIGEYTNIKPILASLYEIYEKKLQVPFFTGFITLGSFLLTLKTFVIVKLKESLYDSESYTDIIEKHRSLDPNLPFYDPLNNLARFLVYAVIMSISTAASQMTLGFLPFNWAAAICISLAVTTLYLVLIAWWNIKRNLSDLFAAWEKQKRPKDTSSAAELRS